VPLPGSFCLCCFCCCWRKAVCCMQAGDVSLRSSQGVATSAAQCRPSIIMIVSPDNEGDPRIVPAGKSCVVGPITIEEWALPLFQSTGLRAAKTEPFPRSQKVDDCCQICWSPVSREHPVGEENYDDML
jgi:hypothetical protein